MSDPGKAKATAIGENGGQDGGDTEGRGGLCQTRRIVDSHLWSVAVLVRALVWLTVNQRKA
ncbi:MAG: hypothetical protein ACK4KV_17265 [Rhodocyclaceae bacterium]